MNEKSEKILTSEFYAEQRDLAVDLNTVGKSKASFEAIDKCITSQKNPTTFSQENL